MFGSAKVCSTLTARFTSQIREKQSVLELLTISKPFTIGKPESAYISSGGYPFTPLFPMVQMLRVSKLIQAQIKKMLLVSKLLFLTMALRFAIMRVLEWKSQKRKRKKFLKKGIDIAVQVCYNKGVNERTVLL